MHTAPKFPQFGSSYGPYITWLGFALYYNKYTKLLCWTTPFALYGMVTFNPAVRWAGSRFVTFR